MWFLWMSFKMEITMKRLSLLSLIMSGVMVSSVANANDWNNWTSNVDSSNGHAGSAATNGNFSDIKNNVDSIDSTLTQHVKDQEAVNKKQSAINDSQSAWNKAQEGLNNQQRDINQKQADTNANQSTWNKSQESINNQQASVNQQQSTVNQRQDQWNHQQEGVNTQQQIVNRTLTQQNAQMRNDINSLHNRVDNLDNKMKRGFASQAALSGLFQPYSVGRFNLSTSVGGYESTNALAVGSGYRFNDNVAAKAGVSTNTEDFKGVTYNAAINVEW